jgi:crotonobetainyl-CoA:carnitine CoA-transferase CaiB-like acyl-CoA transferase
VAGLSAGMPAGLLEGVRVLDLTSVVMGPYATQVLGDLGADVINVEGSQVDINRLMGVGPHPELSGVALNLLRNKRSVALDLKHPDGRAALMRLAASCDVFVTNLRVGALERARLTYDDVAAVRPDVVYCEAHGFARGTARDDDPAYDDVIQAASGLADAAQIQFGAPQLAPTILADKVCGLTIAYAVAAALFVEHGAAAIPQPPLGPAGYPRILVPHRRPQRTIDGWIHVLPYSLAHYRAIFVEGGRADLLDDERVATSRSRIANSDILYQWVADVMATRTTAEWLTFCRGAGVPVTEVGRLEELVAALPAAEHPVAGTYKEIPPPVRFAEAPSSVRRPAPLLGEHTDEVLDEVGYSADDIAALRESGAVPSGRREG